MDASSRESTQMLLGDGAGDTVAVLAPRKDRSGGQGQEGGSEEQVAHTPIKPETKTLL